MQNSTEVTIGIPTYNQQAYIRQTLSGCINQTYANISVIIADDQSADETEKVIEQFDDDRIVYKKNSERLGRIQNYHKLLYEYASGASWYINLDGDDYFINKDFINSAMHFINSRPSENIVVYQANHNLDAIKKVLPVYQELGPFEIMVSGKDYFQHFPRIRHFIHCATIYNRISALPLNFYSFDCLFTDSHSILKLSLTGNVILSSRKVAVWREHAENESKSLTNKNLNRELASLDDLAIFAKSFFTNDEVSKWLKKMKEYYKMIFIYHKSTFSPGWGTIGFIMKHWRFNWLYPRYIIKNLVLMVSAFFYRQNKNGNYSKRTADSSS